MYCALNISIYLYIYICDFYVWCQVNNKMLSMLIMAAATSTGVSLEGSGTGGGGIMPGWGEVRASSCNFMGGCGWAR